jgi:hypothetical protein
MVNKYAEAIENATSTDMITIDTTNDTNNTTDGT